VTHAQWRAVPPGARAAVGIAAFGALIPVGTGQGSADAFVTGFRHVVLIGCAVTLAGAVAVTILIGTRRARTDATSLSPRKLADTPASPGR
jgi:hypothetical protein